MKIIIKSFVLTLIMALGLLQTECLADKINNKAENTEVVATDKSSNLDDAHILIINAHMLILPGTSEYLNSAISQAEKSGAKALIVQLDTPGGMLNVTQEMIQSIFKSNVPVIVYVTPSGATATSAGVFITLAGHIAAMAPGTSIGAAHPVTGEGKDIEGDMRKKAENMTVAMVKSITEQRKRSTEWAEKAIRESNSITEKEALSKNVIDIVAEDVTSLLKQIKGKKILINNVEFELPDYSELRRETLDISFKQKSINVLANPSVLALLWLAATTGLSIELYNPGLILPGVVGAICLVLALAMSQVIPITQGGLVLLVLGAAMIASELFITSGVLGIGGVISIILGSIYLVDTSVSPDLKVNLGFIIPTALTLGSFMLFLVYSIVKVSRKKESTGSEAMIGMTAKALGDFKISDIAGSDTTSSNNLFTTGKVMVNGEVWRALAENSTVLKGQLLKVEKTLPGMVLKCSVLNT